MWLLGSYDDNWGWQTSSDPFIVNIDELNEWIMDIDIDILNF